MLEKELSFADLSISLSELYEAMGYADAVPDEAVEKEVRGVLGRVEAVTSPRFCFFKPGQRDLRRGSAVPAGDLPQQFRRLRIEHSLLQRPPCDQHDIVFDAVIGQAGKFRFAHREIVVNLIRRDRVAGAAGLQH